MSISPKNKSHFIKNFLTLEAASWMKAAGSTGYLIYSFYTWKNEMLKARMKTPNHNYWITIDNDAFRKEIGKHIHRETKTTALKKLAAAGLIELKLEPGSAYKVLKIGGLKQNEK